MTILFLTTHVNTGGITSYLLSLTSGLLQKGHHVYVASAGGDCQSLLEDAGVKHLKIPFRTKSEVDPRIYLNLNQFKNIIIEERIDIIHAQTRVMQVMGHFLSRMTYKPLITTCHGFFKPRFFRRIFPCWGVGTIAVSKPVAEHLKNDFNLPENQVYVISNGIDGKRFNEINETLKFQQRKKWNVQANIVIGIIARLSDVKGIDILLESMNKVIEVFPDALLMIVGEGPEYPRLVRMVDELNLKNNVRFEKIVNQTANILPIFDVFVMPSRQEGLGLSVMEAQACALPVIASKVGGLVDLIEDEKTGYLVSSQDPNSLADRIIFVLKNQQQAQKVGVAARKHILEKFSLDQMVQATIKVYEKYSRH